LANAYDQISEMLQKKEKVDGIICLEATEGPGCQRLHPIGLEGKVPIVAFTKDPETLGFDRKGRHCVDDAQKPYVMSY